MKPIIADQRVRTIAIIVIAVLVLALVTYGVLKLTGVLDKMNEDREEKEFEAAVDKEISSGGVVTLSDITARMYAEKLYVAMKGLGTDEEAIYEVFRNMLSRADVYFLIRSFGIKDGQSLPAWIASELNAKERSKLNEILKGNNVNYAF